MKNRCDATRLSVVYAVLTPAVCFYNSVAYPSMSWNPSVRVAPTRSPTGRCHIPRGWHPARTTPVAGGFSRDEYL